MNIGANIKETREKKGFSPDDMSSRLNISLSEYEQIETGESILERWGPILASLAIKLEIPTSRLISETGKSAQAVEGECGALIKRQRERKSLTKTELASMIDLPEEDVAAIESGKSPLEQVGPLLLRCSEIVSQPVFNLLCRL